MPVLGIIRRSVFGKKSLHAYFLTNILCGRQTQLFVSQRHTRMSKKNKYKKKSGHGTASSSERGSG